MAASLGRSDPSQRRTEPTRRFNTTRLLLACLLVALSLPATIVPNSVEAAPSGVNLSAEGSLSPYWRFEVMQWEEQIVRHAEARRLDPDLVAALIWHESQGLSWVESASGAVGLMQVMPSDRGFEHRPTAEQLFRPNTNIDWGTRILSEIIQETKGDLFTALAAYNGGWYQTGHTIPKDYSRQVMTLYAEAVAVRNGYRNPSLGEWGLVIELQGRDDADFAWSPQPGWLLTSHLSGPRTTLGQPVVGAVVYSATDLEGHPWRITMWLLPNA